MNETILIELDETTLLKKINEVEKWFEHVLTAQITLETLLNKTIPAIVEPHIREALEKIQQAEVMHSKSADNLFIAIKRIPDAAKDRALGTVVSKVEEGLLSFQDMMGGAVGSWQGIHHLMLLNQQAMGAFAVAEQLGLALGIKEIAAIAFPIVHEKSMHQLLLQEYMLEMAAIAILYKQDI
jgi:hypothetical protein